MSGMPECLTPPTGTGINDMCANEQVGSLLGLACRGARPGLCRLCRSRNWLLPAMVCTQATPLACPTNAQVKATFPLTCVNPPSPAAKCP